MTAISATAPARRVSPLSGMRNTFTLTWRSVLKIRTNMEDVIGLSLQPIMFLLLFTYVFGGAIAHGSTWRRRRIEWRNTMGFPFLRQAVAEQPGG